MTDFNPYYLENKKALSDIDSLLLSKDALIEFVDIASYNCPSSTRRQSITICNNRTNKIIELLMQQKYKKSFKIIPHKNIYVTWDNLAKLIPNKTWFPNAKALSIIKGNENDSIKKSKIIALDKQQTYNYIKKKYFAQLRYSDIYFTYHTPINKVSNSNTAPLINKIDFAKIAKVDTCNIKKTPQSTSVERKVFPLALKTNLIYDILGIVNLGAELPIQNNWSIAAEFNYSGWFSESKQRSIQSCWGNIEGRYWLMSRTASKRVKGLFAGIYTSGGVYDLEWREKGYQGNFYSFGISSGYVYKLTRDFSIENSLNIGFLHTKYDKYNAIIDDSNNSWKLAREYKGTFNWFGPTMIKASLIWCPSFKNKTTKP